MSGQTPLRSPSPPPSLRLRTKLLALAFALLVAGGLAEAMVRIGKPGFPGFLLPQVEHRPAPVLGFEMIPGQVTHSTASRVTINRDGFRGPDVRPLADAGVPRVLCLGDSMTFGVAVEDNETYAQQLQALLSSRPGVRNPEVINAGVQRYFTFQEIDLLKKVAAQWRPDIVTLAVYVNDLGVRPTEDYVREYENEREQAATAFRSRFPTVYYIIKNSALLELAKNLYVGFTERRTTLNTTQMALAGRTNKRDDAKWASVEQEFTTFLELSRTHQFQPIVIFVPIRAQVRDDVPESLYPRRLIEHARRLGLTAIDPVDAFKQALRSGNDPFLPWDDHMSVTGHRIFAELLAAGIDTSAIGHGTDTGGR